MYPGAPGFPSEKAIVTLDEQRKRLLMIGKEGRLFIEIEIGSASDSTRKLYIPLNVPDPGDPVSTDDVVIWDTLMEAHVGGTEIPCQQFSVIHYVLAQNLDAAQQLDLSGDDATTGNDWYAQMPSVYDFCVIPNVDTTANTLWAFAGPGHADVPCRIIVIGEVA